MYEASYDTNKNWNTMEEIIDDLNLDAKEILRYLVDYHGLQLLSYDFMENLIDCEL